MTKSPPKEVGPATALVAVLVVVVAIVLAYSVLLGPGGAPSETAATSTGQIAPAH